MKYEILEFLSAMYEYTFLDRDVSRKSYYNVITFVLILYKL